MQLTDLLSTALIGTAHAPLDELDTHSDLAVSALLTQLPQNDPAHALLATAGTLALQREIVTRNPYTVNGSRITDYGLRITDHEYQTPNAALTLLTELCLTSNLSLLPTLLAGFTAHGWHVPMAQLPHLLELGQKHNSLKPHIPPVLDNNGRWLARQNPAWRYALWVQHDEAALLDAWAKAELPHRLAMLAWARHHDPALGLRLVRSRWHNDGDPFRRQQLQGLLAGLSAADEPFLEKAMDDRQLTIRRKAQELLGHLPTSAFAQRMRGYANIMLRWQPRRTPPVVVRMPANFTSAMQRDGLLPQTEKQTAYFVSRRLTAVIAATPLDHWTERTKADIATFLTLVGNSNWQRTFTAGLVTAVQRQQRADWAEQLIAWGSQGELKKPTFSTASLLTDDTFAKLVLQTTATVEEEPLPLARTTNLHKLLSAWKRPFPAAIMPPVADAVTLHLARLDRTKPPDTTLRTVLRRLVIHCPPEHYQTVDAVLQPNDPPHHERTKSTLRQVRKELSLRQKIQEVLGEL